MKEDCCHVGLTAKQISFVLKLSKYILGHIMVGPVTVKRPSQLPPEFESFLNSSGGYGFVMASFGSYLEEALGKEKLNILATAFGKLKQRVLWKLNEGECFVILL